jgi:hypothetical protein
MIIKKHTRWIMGNRNQRKRAKKKAEATYMAHRQRQQERLYKSIQLLLKVFGYSGLTILALMLVAGVLPYAAELISALFAGMSMEEAFKDEAGDQVVPAPCMTTDVAIYNSDNIYVLDSQYSAQLSTYPFNMFHLAGGVAASVAATVHVLGMAARINKQIYDTSAQRRVHQRGLACSGERAGEYLAVGYAYPEGSLVVDSEGVERLRADAFIHGVAKFGNKDVRFLQKAGMLCKAGIRGEVLGSGIQRALDRKPGTRTLTRQQADELLSGENKDKGKVPKRAKGGRKGRPHKSKVSKKAKLPAEKVKPSPEQAKSPVAQLGHDADAMASKLEVELSIKGGMRAEDATPVLVESQLENITPGDAPQIVDISELLAERQEIDVKVGELGSMYLAARQPQEELVQQDIAAHNASPLSRNAGVSIWVAAKDAVKPLPLSYGGTRVEFVAPCEMPKGLSK